MLNLLQKALQRYLDLDPQSAIRLQQLNGKRVALQLRGIDSNLQLEFVDGVVHLHHSRTGGSPLGSTSSARHSRAGGNPPGSNASSTMEIPAYAGMTNDTHVDTTITGTPLRLLNLSLAPKALRKQFFADDITITGDLDLAQHVIDLFDHLEIDWEELLANRIGDAPAYHISRYAREFLNWSKQTQAILLQDANEFLHEELTLFPTPESLQDFFHDVDSVRMDADRLAARVQKLQAKVRGKV